MMNVDSLSKIRGDVFHHFFNKTCLTLKCPVILTFLCSIVYQSIVNYLFLEDTHTQRCVYTLFTCPFLTASSVLKVKGVLKVLGFFIVLFFLEGQLKIK